MPSENVGGESSITYPMEDRGGNRANPHSPPCAKQEETEIHGGACCI